MNKTDLIKHIAEKAKVTQTAASDILNTLFEEIPALLAGREDSIQVPGFGTFKVRKRAAREGRNPKTGAAIKIQATMVASFSAGNKFKIAINKRKK